jgi:hypothetical protein
LDRNPPPSSPQQALARALARLPAAARSKYQRLLSEAEDATALVNTMQERRRTADGTCAAVEARYRLLNPRDAPERLAAAKDELDQARAVLAEIETALSARNTVKARADQLVARLKQFLATEMHGPIRPATYEAARTRART